MTVRKTKVVIGERTSLVSNPVIIDGIARAGKFLLANLLSGIRGVEPVQIRPVMEHVSRLHRFGLINTKAAKEVLQVEADMACYEMLIGRNFNYRASDKSSIFNNANYKTYLKRLRQPDGEAALAHFYDNKLLSLFIIHESLPNINIFFDTFPSIKIIIMHRSPVDLVYSWYQRKLGQRLGNDPLMGEIPFQGTKSLIPWYLYNHQKEYGSLPGMDRTVLSICTLFKMYQLSYNALSPKKKRILFIRYEDILSDPQTAIKTIAHFLKKEILPEMKQVIKREKLPNRIYLDLKGQKIEKIRKTASKKYFNKLLFLEKEYFNVCQS